MIPPAERCIWCGQPCGLDGAQVKLDRSAAAGARAAGLGPRRRTGRHTLAVTDVRRLTADTVAVTLHVPADNNKPLPENLAPASQTRTCCSADIGSMDGAPAARSHDRNGSRPPHGVWLG